MPQISAFYGIVITMYYDDHPPPHLHARYAGAKAVYTLAGERFAGRLPPRAEALVLEWTLQHREELAANWERCRTQQAPLPVAPLD